MQRRSHSLIESVLNTLSGFAVTMLAQALIYPLYNIETSARTNIEIALIFTGISIARSYFWRRLFNALHEKGVL